MWLCMRAKPLFLSFSPFPSPLFFSPPLPLNPSFPYPSWINNHTRTSWDKQPSQKSPRLSDSPSHPYKLISHGRPLLCVARATKRFPTYSTARDISCEHFWQRILTIALGRKTVWGASGKNVTFGARQTLGSPPALPLNTWVTLGESLNLLDFWFPHL